MKVTVPYLDSKDTNFKLGPVRVGQLRLNEKDRAFVFQVGRLRPKHNGIHGVWEPIGGRAEWNMEFGHVLVMEGRVLDPRRSRRQFFEAVRAELDERSRIDFEDEVIADEIIGTEPPLDDYI